MRILSRNLFQICVVLSFCSLTTYAEAQTDTTSTVQAEDILLGHSVNDTLSTIGEIKYYKLKVTESLEITLTLNSFGFDANANIVLF